ncbi:BPSL0067 family protein [Cronobacter turicensis]
MATFEQRGRYGNHTDGRSHAAIYPGQNAYGIVVLDQWMGHFLDSNSRRVSKPHPVSERLIRFIPQPRLENVGDNDYVVE